MKHIFQLYKASYVGLSTESWMLSLVMLLNRIGGMVIPFLTVYMITNLGFSIQQAGWVMSCFGIGGLIGSVIGGWLTDKFGAFYIQFLSLLFAVPIFIWLFLLKSVFWVALAILLLSMVNECFRPANSAAVTLYAKPENLTRSFSLNRMAINLGFSFGPALGGFLATFSYAWLFYGNSAASGIAALVFFAYFFRRKPRVAVLKNQIVVNKDDVALKSPYLDKWFIIFSAFCFFFSCVFFQLIVILPMYYEAELHFNQAVIGFLLAFNGVFVFLTEMPIVHWIEKKLNIYHTLMLGAGSLFLAFLILMIQQNLTTCLLSMTFLSISELLIMPFIATVAAKRAGESNLGSYMGLQGLSTDFAFVVMPILATQLVKISSFNMLWSVNLFLMLVTFLGFFWVKNNMPLKED